MILADLLQNIRLIFQNHFFAQWSNFIQKTNQRCSDFERNHLVIFRRTQDIHISSRVRWDYWWFLFIRNRNLLFAFYFHLKKDVIINAIESFIIILLKQDFYTLPSFPLFSLFQILIAVNSDTFYCSFHNYE